MWFLTWTLWPTIYDIPRKYHQTYTKHTVGSPGILFKGSGISFFYYVLVKLFKEKNNKKPNNGTLCGYLDWWGSTENYWPLTLVENLTVFQSDSKSQILFSTVTLQPIKAPVCLWLPRILFPFSFNNALFTISTLIMTTVQPHAVISSHPVTSISNVFITTQGFWHPCTHTFQLFSTEHTQYS